MKATGAWEFFCIRFGCPVRGEKRAFIIIVYYGSGAFIVNRKNKADLSLLCNVTVLSVR